MKKLFSLVLVAAMLLCMAPAFSLFAEETPDYTSIDSVEEYLAFVAAVNDGSYVSQANHKVNVDLDFTGIDGNLVTIQNKASIYDMALDFQGHTVSNLVREVTLTDHGNVGLIVDSGNNYTEILNLKIKDSKLTVTMENGAWGMVGAYFGQSDRSYANSCDLENVTIELNGSGAVGMIYGEKMWQDHRGPDTSVTAKNVKITATNGSIGLVTGRQSYEDGDSIKLTKLDVTGSTFSGTNEVTATTYMGICGEGSTYVTLGDGVTANVALVDNATGYVPAPETVEPDTTPVEPDTTPVEPETKPAETGDAIVVLAALAVVALAATVVVSKKRSTAC